MSETRVLVKNVHIIGCKFPVPRGWLLIEKKKITEVGVGDPLAGLEENVDEVVDGSGLTLMPGLIDLHTHGAMGHEFMEPDPDVWQDLSEYYALHGTTGLLATTWTASQEALLQVIETARQVMGHERGARILGVHLEGPFINPMRKGAQNPLLIRTATEGESQQYLESNVVKLIALAPEIPENRALIQACVQNGITVSAGHTDASYEEMVDAVDLGITQVTHCFNAMRPLNHRQPGTVGAALTLEGIRCELIADNIHVHPAVMKLMARARGLEGIILITDSIQPAGMVDGEYMLEGQKVALKNGEARLEDGTLAGSTLSLEKGLHHFIRATNETLEHAWVCASLNPATSIHLQESKGSIEPGKDADLVLLDSDFNVHLTMVEGSIVYRRAA